MPPHRPVRPNRRRGPRTHRQGKLRPVGPKRLQTGVEPLGKGDTYTPSRHTGHLPWWWHLAVPLLISARFQGESASIQQWISKATATIQQQTSKLSGRISKGEWYPEDLWRGEGERWTRMFYWLFHQSWWWWVWRNHIESFFRIILN